MQAKQAIPDAQLVVGVCSDALTHRYKGLTVLNEKERYEMLRQCRWVDEVIEDAPWVITRAFIDQHRLDYVAHDPAPYPIPEEGVADVYGWLKEEGRFIPTRRTEGISTTELIERVLNNARGYRERNAYRLLQRRSDQDEA